MKNLIEQIMKYLPIALLFVSIICVTLFARSCTQRDTINRLESNVKALQGDLKHFQTKDKKSASEIKTLTLTVSELKKSAFEQELKSLSIKARDVKSLQEIATETIYEFKVIPRDSIIYDTVRATTFDYHNQWVDFSMICPPSDSCSTHIATRDSILVVQHAQTKHFLWWTWKKYSGRCTVKNYNPHSTITTLINTEITK